jgi:protein-disulfide isomerase
MEEKKASRNKAAIISLIVIAVFVALVLYLVFKPASSTLSIGDSPVLGDADAPVVIYEFTDFSCPYCEAAEGANDNAISAMESKYPGWEAPMPLIKEQYVKTGKVKIVFKYFKGHGAAEAAHAVAFGVYEQNPDLFWEFEEKAFASSDLSNVDKMIALAVSLGANETRLSEYVSSKAYAQRFADDKAMGAENKVTGTPVFFINGEKVEGAQSFSVFQDIIDKEL